MTRPDDRQQALVQARNLKMARSAHAYVRGSTQKFYEWLDGSAGKTPEGPAVWICGDCHVGNLGPLADVEGRVAMQIRDLDQTVIGNPAHDLIRLGLSLASAARSSDLPGVTTARVLEALMDGYEIGLAAGSEAVDEPHSVQKLIARSVHRRWRHLAEERLEDVEPKIPLGKRFWVLAAGERAAIRDLIEDEPSRALLIGEDGAADAPVELVDAAYWKKGCSSLGRLRYAALVRIGEGKGARFRLVDLKEGVTAAAPRAAEAKMPRDNAQRVVAGARALSPNLGERMLAARMMDKAIVVRELTPQDLKLEVDRLTEAQAVKVARYLASVVGQAHGRQMPLDVRGGWLAELARNRGRSLDAPLWLWSNVVELVAIHEAAYLEHCRRFALAEAA